MRMEMGRVLPCDQPTASVGPARVELLPPRPRLERRMPVHSSRDESLRKLVLRHQFAKRVIATREEEERQRRKYEQKRRVQPREPLKAERMRYAFVENSAPKRPHLEDSQCAEFGGGALWSEQEEGAVGGMAVAPPPPPPIYVPYRSCAAEVAMELDEEPPALIQSVVDFLMDS